MSVHSPLSILVVYGTRPEVIKVAPVIAALRARPGVSVYVLSTGQHRDLAPTAEKTFAVVPDERLDVMRSGQSLVELHCRTLTALTDRIADIAPDMVVVQGDTTTTLAAAQAAFYCRVPVAHVESGVRSHVRYAPFPEEMNRRIVTAIAHLHFAPTRACADNLGTDHPSDARVFVTGNTVIDAVAEIARRLDTSRVREECGIPAGDPFILATVHRRESWGEPVARIGAALREILERHPRYRLVLPLHPNRMPSETLASALAGHPRAHLLSALPYEAFVALLRECHFVITDSGGLQEEAPYFDKPVVVVREETDRPEAVASGNAVLATTDREAIVRTASQIIDEPDVYARMAESPNPFGDGRAAERIASGILSFFGRAEPPDPF
jgi:UDP-N-acetylglucosamine 2-epimerase (non-hydrolysing)